MQNDNFKSYLHLHLIVFIWGFTAILGALISLDALPLVWFRMLFAVLFIGVYIYYKKINLKLPKREAFVFILMGLVIAIHWFTFFKAIKVSNVSVTLACLSTGALFTSILEPIFLRKKPVFYEMFFGILVVFGLYVIFQVEGDYVFGILIALTSAFLSALFSVVNSQYANKQNPAIISFYELSGGVAFFSLVLLFNQSFDWSFFQISLSDLGYLLILSSICTAYAFIASVKVMKHISPYTVMLTINLEPIYGIILAVVIFKEKEQMSPSFYVGALIILSTVLMNGVIKYFLKKKKQSMNN